MLTVVRKKTVLLTVIVWFRAGSEVGCADGRHLEMYCMGPGRGIFGKFALGLGDDGKE